MEKDIYQRYGLTTKQVTKKIAEGQVNIIEDTISKTYRDILVSNTFTFFNGINVVLFFIVLLVGSYRNTLFMWIIILNTGNGIYQEIKAKRTLDKLSILHGSTVQVIRDHEIQPIALCDLVKEDAMVLTAGKQVPADAIVLQGQVEVNEALLTGEADNIHKSCKDTLYSGSFISTGTCICQVIHVGQDNYMQQITKEAKKFKKHVSQLHRSLNQILTIISILIIPLGLLLFSKQFFFTHNSLQSSVLGTVAAVLGMIPEGLILLTSVALTLSVLRLAKQHTLVQGLYCIETLARVDTLCLDKTGTITEGSMQVESVDTLTHMDVETIMGNFVGAMDDDNVTMTALKEHFSKDSTYDIEHVIPFSSQRKYSGVSFVTEGTYYLGAIQFLLPETKGIVNMRYTKHVQEGYRVLVLVHSPTVACDDVLPRDFEPLALILLSDTIREDASATLAYFHEQGVQCKVISGDDPCTVSSIASRAGLQHADAYIDATTLQTKEALQEAVAKYHIFGRVTPKQKKEMVQCLQELGHTVAMTGDGVNDVLAFKEADCSIAMASGSDAAKNAADLVLLNNNFSAMPHIVNEGRRVINNITMAAAMFLIKTMFSTFIAFATLLVGKVYPFEPIQLSIINLFCVGLPSFLLAYESNFTRIKGNFLKNVASRAFPPALTITIGCVVIVNVGLWMGQPMDSLSTISIIFTAWNYMYALSVNYAPLTSYRTYVLRGCQLLYFISMIIGQQLLNLAGVGYVGLVFIVGLLNFSPEYYAMSKFIFHKLYILFLKSRKLTYKKKMK